MDEPFSSARYLVTASEHHEHCTGVQMTTIFSHHVTDEALLIILRFLKDELFKTVCTTEENSLLPQRNLSRCSKEVPFIHLDLPRRFSGWLVGCEMGNIYNSSPAHVSVGRSLAVVLSSYKLC